MARKDMGVPDLKRALGLVEAKVAKKLLRTSLRSAAKLVAAEIRANAPVAEGLLKRSVKVRAGRRRKNYIGVEITVEGGRDEGFVGFVEWGSRHQAANPFARRSVEAKRAEALDAIAEGVESALG